MCGRRLNAIARNDESNCVGSGRRTSKSTRVTSSPKPNRPIRGTGQSFRCIRRPCPHPRRCRRRQRRRPCPTWKMDEVVPLRRTVRTTGPVEHPLHSMMFFFSHSKPTRLVVTGHITCVGRTTSCGCDVGQRVISSFPCICRHSTIR